MPLLPTFPAPPQTGEVFVDTGDGTLDAVGSFEGIVRDVAWVGDAVWVAGHFRLDGGGPSRLAVWQDDAWSTAPGGGVDGPVYALLPAGDGVFVGGSFSQIGGIAAQSVASWDGEDWSALNMQLEPSASFGPFVGPIVHGLARDDDGTLYAGGAFYPAGEATAGGVAQWTGTSWEIVGSGFAAAGGIGADDPAVVADVVVHQGDLFAAGCLSRSGDDPSGTQTLPGVARWNGTSWEAPAGSELDPVADLWFRAGVCGAEPSGTAILEANIQALHSDGTRLFVGGSFGGVAGVPSKSVIAHDGNGWVPQAETSGLGTSGTPSELVVGDPQCGVYALGAISHAGGVPGFRLFRLAGGAWTAVADADLTCQQLAVSEMGDVYLGCQNALDLEDPPVPRVYRLDGTDWVDLGEIPGGEGVVADLVFDGQGRLWSVGGGVGGYVAMLDDGAWSTVEAGFDGQVMAIAFDPEDDSALVVGGAFTSIGAVEASGVAGWDGSTWSALGEAVADPSIAPVRALAYGADGIYASAAAPGFGALEHMILGRWDGTSWEELGVPERGLAAPVEGTVHEFQVLHAVGEHVVAVGSVWPETGGRNVFAFDGEAFTAIGDGVETGSVDTIAVSADALWFGGPIATTGSGDELAPSVGIARFELGND
jgi:hypothetical protein